MASLIENNVDLLKDSDYTIQKLRERREKECFSIVNRGAVWYETLTISQKEDLKKWYNEWLNVTNTLQPPSKPIWL